MTGTYVRLVYAQAQVLNTMARFKKPEDTRFLFKLFGEANEEGETVKRNRKSPIDMVKCICDSYQLLLYPSFDDVKALIDTISEFYD